MTNDDLIRRGDAIRIVKGAWTRSKTPEDFYAITVTAFENILPSAQPERKKGEWIQKPNIYGVAYCSECDYELHTDNTNYCPNCGSYNGGES